jgi:hypothetical protein
MKTVTLSIANRVYDITLKEPFEEDMREDIVLQFSLDRDNDVKRLLAAYLEKSYENYQLKKEIEVILDKLP